jgi:hypothetical protein
MIDTTREIQRRRFTDINGLKATLTEFYYQTWQRLIHDGIIQRLAVQLTKLAWYSRGWTFQGYLFLFKMALFPRKYCEFGFSLCLVARESTTHSNTMLPREKHK